MAAQDIATCPCCDYGVDGRTQHRFSCAAVSSRLVLPLATGADGSLRVALPDVVRATGVVRALPLDDPEHARFAALRADLAAARGDDGAVLARAAVLTARQRGAPAGGWMLGCSDPVLGADERGPHGAQDGAARAVGTVRP